MKPYYYQVLRYVHDQFTGEFVNLGVIVYSPENDFLKAKMTNRFSRITSLFPEAKGKFIVDSARLLENRINQKIAPQLVQLFHPSTNLEQITSSILKRDDSALQLTMVQKAVDIDLDLAVTYLFESLVNKYLPDEGGSKRLNDDEVWRKKYKDYFDKYKVSDRLTSHTVKTQNDVFPFEKAWKNEIWHCYEPLSFDLKREETVRDKVYRWVGKINELTHSTEDIHLTFLASIPKKHQPISNFVKTSLQIERRAIHVDIVFESEAESLAKRIANEMEEHDSHL
ncbi:DUF3037 domain-containing protein [Algoriphagus persicinus]|uniref:DUF3037 domain-containing protein n=1 Tax=Algoriphagus persicinus TaxID=3108754 RepID=UPI002B3FA8B3|nr:DUF3037 domain-containing protein [Algoriphagus sp. E1-3-M2]MEB2785567.1 DUF3037 domain-containing protein [Algoriphagus sp. E1-3-M2]